MMLACSVAACDAGISSLSSPGAPGRPVKIEHSNSSVSAMVAITRPPANLTAQRMFSAVSKIKEARDVVKALACAGDLEGLWAVVDSGALPEAVETIPEIALALSNLPSGLALRDVEHLENAWLAEAGVDTPKKLADHLMNASSLLYQVESIDYAIKKGADPLGYVAWVNEDKFEYTLLGFAHAMSSAATVKMLEAVHASGELPIARRYPDGRVETLFDEMVRNSSGSDMTRALMGRLSELGVSRKWSCDIGLALYNYQANGGQLSSVNSRPEHTAMLTMAGFDEPSHWEGVLYIHTARELNTNALIRHLDAAPSAATIMQGMARDGVNLDEFVAATRQTGRAYNFLQLAANYDNALVVKTLLELGCDPYRPVANDDDNAPNAFELAPPNSQSAQLLGIWRANQAILKVAKAAALPRP